MLSKNSPKNVINQEITDVANTAAANSVGPTEQDPAMIPTTHSDTPMEIDDSVVSSPDAINGCSSTHSSSVGIIHGDLPRTSVQANAINGDATGIVVAPAEIHGNTAANKFYHIPTPQGFATPISSDERLTLLNEIERLKLMVFKTTIQSIGCTDGSTVRT